MVIICEISISAACQLLLLGGKYVTLKIILAQQMFKKACCKGFDALFKVLLFYLSQK